MEKRTLGENDPAQDIIRFDYEQTMETIRMLPDIRFRLLALIPFVSGAAIAFLAIDPGKAPLHVVLAGSVAGFAITVGVLVYNQRNTQYKNVTRERGRKLEELLNLPVEGHVHAHEPRYRPIKQVPLGADEGLAILYSTVLAAWLFLITHTALDPLFLWQVAWVATPIAIVALAVSWHGVVHLDKGSKCHAQCVVGGPNKVKQDGSETITKEKGCA